MENEKIEQKNERVLVIDDMFDNIRAARKALEKRGYWNIFEAVNLKEALSYIQDGTSELSSKVDSKLDRPHFDMVLTDLVFPEDGYEWEPKTSKSLEKDIEDRLKSQEVLLGKIVRDLLKLHYKEQELMGKEKDCDPEGKDFKEKAQERIDYLIYDSVRRSPLGIYVVEECQKRGIPCSVVTNIAGHGGMGSLLLAANGILSEREFLRNFERGEESYKDVIGPVKDSQVVFTAHSKKTEEDYFHAIDKAEEMQKKLKR